MENPRPDKVAVVSEVRERFDSADAALLTEYRGLTVTELAALRRSLRESGTDYKVYKNTLVRLAAADAGLTELDPFLTGPTAIAFVSGDAAVAAKVLKDFARTAPALVIKGGLLGKRLLSPEDASALAELPSRDVLLARLAGGLAAPMQKFAAILQALPQNFAYGLSALIDKGGAPGAPAEASEPAATSEAAEPAEATEAPVSAEAPETPAPAEAKEAPVGAEAPETTAPAEAPEAPAGQETAEAVEAPGNSDSSESPATDSAGPDAPAENTPAGNTPAESAEE